MLEKWHVNGKVDLIKLKENLLGFKKLYVYGLEIKWIQIGSNIYASP